MKLPIDDMDKEVVELCQAMNLIPGIRTTESCCGHDKAPYRIWFRPRKLQDLPRLLYYFDVCHCGFKGWHVETYTDCAMRPAIFLLEGPYLKDGALEQSLHIAKLLHIEIEGEEVMTKNSALDIAITELSAAAEESEDEGTNATLYWKAIDVLEGLVDV